MNWIFFAAGVLFLLGSLNVVRSIHKPVTISLLSYLSAMFVSQLPLQILFIEALTLAVLSIWIDISSWQAICGLISSAAAWGLLIRVHAKAQSHRDIFTEALSQSFGPNYQGLIEKVPSKTQLPLYSRITGLPSVPKNIRFRPNIPFARELGLDHDLQLDLFLPEKPVTKAPILLYVHGGGWAVGSRKAMGDVPCGHFAQNGWIAISMSYHLSPKAKLPQQLLDVKNALRWIQRNASEYGGDPAHVYIAGGSAGGHLASLAALTANDPNYQEDFPLVDTSVQGCISFYGVYDLLDDTDTMRNRGLKLLLERFVVGKKRKDAQTFYRAMSPIHRVHRNAPPFFILHGDNDNLVPAEAARRFADALRTHSSQVVSTVELPAAPHAFAVFPSPHGQMSAVFALQFAELIRRKAQNQQNRKMA